jgi:transposase
MKVGIDAHKRSCTVAMFEGDSVTGSFDFPTTRQGVSEFMQKVPHGSTIVIEASTTGKVLSKMLLQKNYDIHMVAPPERKISIKTDSRDSERIVKEDSLGYLRRCYVPTPYIEELRSLVSRQVQTGEDIARVKNRIHSLLESNMVQHEFDGLSDIFGARGLKKMAQLQLPRQDMVTLARYLEELKMHVSHHRQQETELARVAASDKDVKLLMTIPGVNVFTAVAMKARIGDISRFPTKKHLSSYAGVVPAANNSGDYVSQHNHVKHGDAILKYALTCAVNGAAKASKNSSVKLFHQKMINKGVAPQKAQVAAARKMSWIVWKVLSSGQPYEEEDTYLTQRKMKAVSSKASKPLPADVMPAKVQELATGLIKDTDVLEMYPEEQGLSDNNNDGTMEDSPR